MARSISPAEDPSEPVKHKRFIELLAEETARPVEQVEPIYDEILTELEEAAEIPDFVPVFAWRRARTMLLSR